MGLLLAGDYFRVKCLIRMEVAMENSFADRLKQLCSDYYNAYMETPPCPVSSYTRMNSLLAGTRKPTLEELVNISEAYDVSINYLLTGDELFPSLHLLKKEDAKHILDTIEELKPELDV